MYCLLNFCFSLSLSTYPLSLHFENVLLVIINFLFNPKPKLCSNNSVEGHIRKRPNQGTSQHRLSSRPVRRGEISLVALKQIGTEKETKKKDEFQ